MGVCNGTMHDTQSTDSWKKAETSGGVVIASTQLLSLVVDRQAQIVSLPNVGTVETRFECTIP